MEFLIHLWLPIVLSAIALWVASSISWTLLRHHQNDYSPLEAEDEFMACVREQTIAPGKYLFPFLRHEDMKDQALIEKYTTGPRGTLVLWEMPNMPRNLALTLCYFLLIATMTAYISWTALGARQPAATFMEVFQVVGSIGILVFCSSGQLHAIWFPRRTLMDFVDGIAYGLMMGLIFASLWG